MSAHRLAAGAPLSLLLFALAAASAPALAIDGLYDSAGAGDVFFDVNSAATDFAYACAAQSDGKVLLAGTVTTDDSEGHQIAVARIGLDNQLDSTFSGDGKLVIDLSASGIAGTDAQVRAMAVDAQGRVLIAGQLHETAFFNADIGFVMRLLADGTIDFTFQDGYLPGISYDGWMSRVVAIGFDASGRIWTLGPALASATGPWHFEVVSDSGYVSHYGSVDFSAWGPETSAPTAIAFAPDGKVLMGGFIQRPGPSFLASFAIARIDGSTYLPDPSFGISASGLEVLDDTDSSRVRSIAVQPDLRIVVAGEEGPVTQERISVLDLDPNGTYGSAWGEYVAFPFGGSSASGGGGLSRMVVQSDGKILAAAISYTGDPSNITDVRIARLSPAGGLDTSFGGNGTGKVTYDMPPAGVSDGNDQLTCLTLAAGKPVLVGSGHFNVMDWDFSFLRLTNALIFADTFESGSKFFWSGATP